MVLNHFKRFSRKELLCCMFLFIHVSCMEVLLRCGTVRRRLNSGLHFHLTIPCSTSTFTSFASFRARTLEECIYFTRRYRGMALSFLNKGGTNNFSQDSCLVYECPEFNNGTRSLKPISEFNYYSTYPQNPSNSGNMTCIPTIGVFSLHKEKLNYSSAVEVCEQNGGHLALVTSLERTHKLSNLIKTLGLPANQRKVYVGLNDIAREDRFVSALGEPLNCFDFLSWAPGEPRSRSPDEDCVVLDSELNWRVVSCKTKLPFLCELSPASDINVCANVNSYSDKIICLTEYMLFFKMKTALNQCRRNNYSRENQTLLRKPRLEQLPNVLQELQIAGKLLFH